MKAWVRALPLVLPLLASAAAAVSDNPDDYLCYAAALAKGQAKIPKGTTAALTDRLGGPEGFTLRSLTGVCNPVDRDGNGIPHPDVHLEALAIKAAKGSPKFVKSNQAVVDRIAARTLTITAPATFLDVTPAADGSVPPSPFGTDPTLADALVNRFECYKAKLAKGSPKFQPPPAPPTLRDEVFVAGQSFAVKKVTKLCLPVAADGAPPDAATRDAVLVCYAVKEAKGGPKFAKPTLALDDARLGAQVVVAKKPSELCVPGHGADGATPTPTPAAGSTPSPTSTPAAGATPSPTPSDGAPIVAPAGSWTWVDFPDSSCDDGSATGIGINPGTANDVFVYLNGGGICWDYQTCYILDTAVHGPFGASDFAAMTAGFGGTIFDRTLNGNPFADWTMVFVPYCTGDAHGGDVVTAYSKTGQPTKMYHHVGHANLEAYLRRLGPTVPVPDKIVLAGSSAGGFGALFNYGSVRQRWPDAAGYLLDDSGPPLESPALPTSLLDSFYASWHLGDLLTPQCAGCQGDLSLLVPALAAAHPDDRMALTSSLQDQTIGSYFQLSAAQFQTALLALASDHLDPTAHFKYFIVTGQTHTMLGAPASFSQNGTGLLTWLTQQATDDPTWTAIKPP